MALALLEIEPVHISVTLVLTDDWPVKYTH